MEYRPFGSTGTAVAAVGLGTWQLGGTEWGDVTDDTALSVLRAAYDAGTTFFDTADIYGSGRSERLLGQFLRELGSQASAVQIATKLGRRTDSPHGWPQNFTRAAVRQHTLDSLQRLGVEQVFLQQLHCLPFAVLRQGEIFEHLRSLQQEGLIRHWGVSVETVEEGLFCLRQPGCAALQVIYNLLRMKPGWELFPEARRRGVAILARVPLASGLLSGKFSKGHRFEASDHRHFNADGQRFNVGETFAGVPFDRGVELVEAIRQIVGSAVPLATLALRWVLDDANVTTVIPGATQPSQATSNAAAAALPPLPASVHAQLRDLYQQHIAPAIRGPY